MDGSRFDAWTRRRFGLAAGGLLGSLLGVAGRDAAGAKKKKKSKKQLCRTLGQSCSPKGKKACCTKGGLSCQAPVVGPGGRACCLPGNKPCKKSNDCCSGQCTDGVCACKSIGTDCGNLDFVCCSLNCVLVGDVSTCQPA